MERKLKICSDCGKPSVLWKSTPKLCKNCAGKPEYKKKNKDKEETKAELNVYFASQALVFPSNCENCGSPLRALTVADRRKHICHILPKTKKGGFPSIATHPQNRVFMCCMGGCYGHEKWDNGDSSDRIKMAVYSVAIERFKSFEHCLTSAEKIKAYKYLKID